MNTFYPSILPDLLFQYVGLSDIGCRRKKNEDAIGFVADEENDTYLVVVADGVGGNVAGDVASQLAVDTYCEYFKTLEPGQDLGAFLEAGMQAANLAVFNESERNPLLASMATTCTASAIRGNELRVAHIGDCRSYLVYDGQSYQLTRDHNAAEEYESKGIPLPPDKKHLVNVLTRCMGLERIVNVDVYDPVAFQQDSILVQCSDGLLKRVEADEIIKTVSMQLPERACQKLVDLAKERGGPDNISVQIAMYRKK